MVIVSGGRAGGAWCARSHLCHLARKGPIMDRAKMIDKLNEILKWEYAGLVQYTQFSFVVQDTWREVFYKFFRDNGEEALDHAHQVGDKIVALGGVPTVERAEVKQA